MVKQTRAKTQKECTAVKAGVDDGAAKYKQTRSGKRREEDVLRPISTDGNKESSAVFVEKTSTDGALRYPDSDDSDEEDTNQDMDGIDVSESEEEAKGGMDEDNEKVVHNMNDENGHEDNCGKCVFVRTCLCCS